MIHGRSPPSEDAHPKDARPQQCGIAWEQRWQGVAPNALSCAGRIGIRSSSTLHHNDNLLVHRSFNTGRTTPSVSTFCLNDILSSFSKLLSTTDAILETPLLFYDAPDPPFGGETPHHGWRRCRDVDIRSQ
ncbi:hypothetical protein PybrP1_007419 [[Pythium] brassicae (nom. inval.)]|nr:hypothetical protein PybrP1_007419 [[Pythium] brassicae (nom. inval.)]